MPRATTTLKEQVINFYLKAPLADIEDIQGTLRTIYQHRRGIYDAQMAGRVKADTAKEVSKVKGKGKGKGKAAEEGGIGFGGKTVVGEEATA